MYHTLYIGVDSYFRCHVTLHMKKHNKTWIYTYQNNFGDIFFVLFQLHLLESEGVEFLIGHVTNVNPTDPPNHK